MPKSLRCGLVQQLRGIVELAVESVAERAGADREAESDESDNQAVLDGGRT